MSTPAALAASQIVDPSAAVTSRPSIVSVTVPVRSGAVIAMFAVSACLASQLNRRSASWAWSGRPCPSSPRAA